MAKTTPLVITKNRYRYVAIGSATTQPLFELEAFALAIHNVERNIHASLGTSEVNIICFKYKMSAYPTAWLNGNGLKVFFWMIFSVPFSARSYNLFNFFYFFVV